MRQRSVNTVRLQVEALEDRSLPSVTATPLTPFRSPGADSTDDRATRTGTLTTSTQTGAGTTPSDDSAERQTSSGVVTNPGTTTGSAGSDDSSEVEDAGRTGTSSGGTSGGGTTSGSSGATGGTTGGGSTGTTTPPVVPPSSNTPPPVSAPAAPSSPALPPASGGATPSPASTVTANGTDAARVADAPAVSPSSPALSDAKTHAVAVAPNVSPKTVDPAAVPHVDLVSGLALAQAAAEAGPLAAHTGETHAVVAPPASPPVLTDGQYSLPSNGGRAQEVPTADFRGLATDGEESPDLSTPLAVGEGGLGGPAPRAADLIADALAVDADAMQAGVRNFLGLLDQLGTVLTASPGGVSLYYWMLAAAAAGSACWTVRRQTAGLLPAGPDAGNPPFPWDPEGRP